MRYLAGLIWGSLLILVFLSYMPGFYPGAFVWGFCGMEAETTTLNDKVYRLFSCGIARAKAVKAIKVWVDPAGPYSSLARPAIDGEKQSDCGDAPHWSGHYARSLPYPIDSKGLATDEAEKWVLAAAIHDHLCRDVSAVGPTPDSLESGDMRYVSLLDFTEKAISERWGTIGSILSRCVDSLIAEEDVDGSIAKKDIEDAPPKVVTFSPTLQKISDRVHVSASTIREAVKQAGVKRPGPGQHTHTYELRDVSLIARERYKIAMSGRTRKKYQEKEQPLWEVLLEEIGQPSLGSKLPAIRK